MICVGDIWRFDNGDVFVYAIDNEWVHYLWGDDDKIIIDSRSKDRFTEKAKFVENVYHAQAYEQAKNAKPKKLDLLKRIAKEILQ